MVRLPHVILAGITSALLLATASSANAENRHGAMPSRQMYMHRSMHGMHRPMMRPYMRHHHYMKHRYMHRHGMMHRNAM